MEGGFLSLDSSSTNNKKYTEIFEEAFPYYLHIGMTADMYWHGDASLCKAYRQKHELDMQETNQQLWLLGRYVYEAVGALSPILNSAFAFSKQKMEVGEYPKEPFALTSEEQERREREKFEKEKAIAMAKLQAWAKANNRTKE